MGALAPILARGHKRGPARWVLKLNLSKNTTCQGCKAKRLKKPGGSGDGAESMGAHGMVPPAPGQQQGRGTRRTRVPQHQLFITENFFSFFCFGCLGFFFSER